MYDSRLSLHIFCSNSRREGRGFYKDSDDEMVRSKTLSSGEEEERKRQRRDGKLLYDSPVVDKAKLIFRDGPHSSPSTTSAVNVDDACVVQAEFVTPPGKVEQPSATTAPAALNLSSMFDQPASTYLMLKQAKGKFDVAPTALFSITAIAPKSTWNSQIKCAC